MEDPREVDSGSWIRWIRVGFEGLLASPLQILVVVVVAFAVAAVRSATEGNAGLFVTGVGIIPIFAFLMRGGLVSNGLETGVADATFLQGMATSFVGGTLTVGLLVLIFWMIFGDSSEERSRSALDHAVMSVFFIPPFLAIILGRRHSFDHMIRDGYGVILPKKVEAWLDKGIALNRLELLKLRSATNLLVAAGLLVSALTDGTQIGVLVDIVLIVLGCAIWSCRGAALKDIFFGGLEERERRLVPVEAT
jgi:hypothetical protein